MLLKPCTRYHMQYSLLLKDIEAHVRELFEKYAHPYLLYHNLAHTISVVHHTHEIAEYYLYDTHHHFIVTAAAWFHDTGHLLTGMEGHEQKSVELMKVFLAPKNISDEIIQEISWCIMATRMPVKPFTLSEKIICDADTYHLGTEAFELQNNLVKLELEARTGNPVSNWHAASLAFIQSHRYYTSYCQQLLTEGKERNIHKLLAEKGE